MKLLLVLLLLAMPACGQNIYSLIKAGRGLRPLRIARKTVTVPKYSTLAYEAMSMQARKINVSHTTDRIILEAIIEQKLASPVEVSGGYNYLRTVSQNMAKEPGWERINTSDGYNGVHHIINKTVLEKIYNEQAAIENNLTYSEFVRNSPAIFHPFHNNKYFTAMFHCPDKQLYLYYTKGVKGVLEAYFEQINAISKEYGIIEYNQEIIEHSMLEARFWAETYGLEWEVKDGTVDGNSRNY